MTMRLSTNPLLERVQASRRAEGVEKREADEAAMLKGHARVNDELSNIVFGTHRELRFMLRTPRNIAPARPATSDQPAIMPNVKGRAGSSALSPPTLSGAFARR
jgi:hypothetical protein